jgi:PleD family two-component response regulator
VSEGSDKTEIVPSGHRSLSKYGSSLVRRGLDELSKSAENKGRILLVDDEKAILEVTEQLLVADGYEVRSTSKASEAMKLAESFQPQVALLGLVMPVTDGITLGIELRKALPALKVVLWMEVNGTEDMEPLRKAGYDFDLFPCPFEREDLLKQAELWMAEWRHKVLLDEHTGLYKGRFLGSLLDQEISRSEQYNYALSLVRIDLDLKNVMKSLSQENFSQLLTEVGRAIIGGITLISSGFYDDINSEFFLVLPQVSKEVACIPARYFHSLFKETLWLGDKGLDVRLSPRIAVATFPGDGNTKGDLLHAVDEAMDALKKSSHDGNLPSN